MFFNSRFLMGFAALLCWVAASSSASSSAPFFSFSPNDIDGHAVPLAKYAGKVTLVVNTASQCGYTPQYKELESVYEKYQAKGLVVLGFPSNDFGGQEPGSNAEIKKFCTTNYKVSFPMFAKSKVTGEKKSELYRYLTSQAPEKGEIDWNFEKFLISKDGQIIGRFKSSVKPDSAELVASIEQALAQTSPKK